MPYGKREERGVAMRKWTVAGWVIAAVTVALSLAAWAPSDTARPVGAQETVSITVGDDFFDPKTITVPVGTTVIWTTAGRNGHTVTSETGVFDSGTAPFLREGDTFSFTFTEAGTFPYYCLFHGGPGGAGMSGTVVVEPGQQPPTPSPAARPTGVPTPGAAGADVEDGDGDGVAVWWYALAAPAALLLVGGGGVLWALRRRR